MSTALVPSSTGPSAHELDLILRQARLLAPSGIIPDAYAGNEPNIVAAALTGRAFGWDAIVSMRNIHVIKGTATLKPEAMLGMIRGAGHSVKITRNSDGVSIVATRRDNGDTMSSSFTLEDARRASLTGNKNYSNYPVDMCQWRCVAQIARGLFSDVILGLSYTPEEFGMEVNEDGEVIDVTGAPTQAPVAAAPVSAATMAKLTAQFEDAEFVEIDVADIIERIKSKNKVGDLVELTEVRALEVLAHLEKMVVDEYEKRAEEAKAAKPEVLTPELVDGRPDHSDPDPFGIGVELGGQTELERALEVEDAKDTGEVA